MGARDAQPLPLAYPPLSKVKRQCRMNSRVPVGFSNRSWPYWMLSTLLGSPSPAMPLDAGWDLAHDPPLSSATQPNVEGGLLASLTKRADPISQDSSAWSPPATPFGASAGILAPLAQPNNRFEGSSPAWLQSVLLFDGNAASSVAAAQLTGAANGKQLVPPADSSDASRLVESSNSIRAGGYVLANSDARHSEQGRSVAGRVSPESRIKPISYATDPGLPEGEWGCR